ncbi:DUF6089 family protein [Cytophagales bacterium LB-30]|uniref:DUF6089 family protein n=1 Tax=Shiella aurantiaca TaxID=3058365 RepID=A0ABT8F830_9BACT|nr:DUF6089 family protein [Shiella aurantiaca]MDN4166647.1 DUF6089 family protein [Shiella aurantiaca]
MKRLTILVLFIALIAQSAEAQNFYRRKIDRRLIASGSLGLSSYFGELTNPGDYFDTKLNFGAALEYELVDRLSIRANAQWFRIGGSDAEADPNRENRGTRNLSFRSDNFEITGIAQVYLFPNDDKFTQRRPINPYLFAGIGVVYYNPKAELDGTWHALRPLQTEGVEYAPFTTAIPLGIGVRFKLTNEFDAAVEVGYRYVTTDYLDDVSDSYIAQEDYISDLARQLGDRRVEIGLPPAREGGIRGNPDAVDGYMIINARLGYYLPAGLFSKGNKSSVRMYGKRSKNMYKQKRRR